VHPFHDEGPGAPAVSDNAREVGSMSFSTISRSGVAVAVLVAVSTTVGIAPAQAEPGCTSGMLDLNGDGHKDVAVGAPDATVNGKAGAGLVEVRMRTDAGEVVRTVTAPLPKAGDHFGAAVGDVDLSSHEDEGIICSSLVVGAPGWDAGSDLDAGAVFVFPTLDATPVRLDQNFNEESPGTQADAHFGAVLTEQSTGSGDNQLVRDPVFYASAPDYDLGVTTDAGVVQRIRLAGSGNPAVEEIQTISGSSGFRGQAEKGDRFGAAMTGTPYPDELVVGAPGESIGSATSAGEIWFWTPDGQSQQVINQNTAGIPGTAETGDGFGSSVFLGTEVANAAHLRGHDVAVRLFVGTPREDLAGKADAGGVVQLGYTPPTGPGGHGRLVTSGALFWTQDSAGVAGAPEAGDLFGSATESLDLTTAGIPTFVTGAPGEDLGSVKDAGAGYTLGGNRSYDQNTAGVPGSVEAGDRFGAVLGSWRDIGAAPPPSVPPGPGTWSSGLLVGAPGEDAGRGVVVRGLPHGSVAAGTQWVRTANGAARYGAALSATR
jgi:hypothetical protein